MATASILGMSAAVRKASTADSPSVLVVFYLLIIIVLLLDILQIIMFVRDNLSPGAFLTMNCVQTGFWGGVLLMNLVYIGKEHTSAAGIGFTVFLLCVSWPLTVASTLLINHSILFLILLIYAAVGVHRQRKQAKRGNYAPTPNPAIHPPVPPSYHATPLQQQSTAYHSPMHAGGDLGQYQSPYASHGAAADYYAEPATKPAHMV